MVMNWTVVPESNDENGVPGLWAAEPEKGKFIWIEREVDGFAVIAPDARTVLKMYKTRTSALRLVTMHIVEIMMEG